MDSEEKFFSRLRRGHRAVHGSFLIDHFDECDLVTAMDKRSASHPAKASLAGENAPKRPDGHRAVNFFAEPPTPNAPEPGQ